MPELPSKLSFTLDSFPTNSRRTTSRRAFILLPRQRSPSIVLAPSTLLSTQNRQAIPVRLIVATLQARVTQQVTAEIRRRRTHNEYKGNSLEITNPKENNIWLI